MRALLLSLLLASTMSLTGCSVSTRVYDYSKRGALSSTNQPRLVEVKVKVLNGLKQVEPQMSVAKSYDFEASLLSGQIPGDAGIKKVRVRLFHDWTDALVKDDAVLTLRLTDDGSLFDIKEFIITSPPTGKP